MSIVPLRSCARVAHMMCTHWQVSRHIMYTFLNNVVCGLIAKGIVQNTMRCFMFNSFSLIHVHCDKQ